MPPAISLIIERSPLIVGAQNHRPLEQGLSQSIEASVAGFTLGNLKSGCNRLGSGKGIARPYTAALKVFALMYIDTVIAVAVLTYTVAFLLKIDSPSL